MKNGLVSIRKQKDGSGPVFLQYYHLGNARARLSAGFRS